MDGCNSDSSRRRCSTRFTRSSTQIRPALRWDNRSARGGTATYVGLPVIGFAAQSFFNGTLNVDNKLVQSTYGGNFVQKGTRLIVTEAPIE